MSFFVVALANGMAMLLLPLHAMQLGWSVASAGVLLTLRGVGTLASIAPIAMGMKRFGEWKMTLLCLGGMALSCVMLVFVQNRVAVSVAVLVFGAGMGGVGLARHSFISSQVKNQQRGRAIAKLATVQRIGFFLGPLLGGGVAHYESDALAFALAAGVLFLGITLCVLCGEANREGEAEESVDCPRAGRQATRMDAFFLFLNQHKFVFMTAGVFVICVRLLRGSWQFLLPIWGDHIGLNRGEIGVIFAISTLVDCVMLYPGGYTADRWGRKWSAIPGVAILSLSMLMLSSCLTFSALLLVAVLAGVANGISGGIIMTLGSDWAPRATRGTFLAVWRFLSDSSGALSPVLIAGLSSLWSLSGALYVSGAIGMMGGMLMLIWGQETVRKNRNADTSIE